jgi:hypothetical protein
MATDLPEALRLRYRFGHVEVEAAVGTGPVVMADVADGAA